MQVSLLWPEVQFVRVIFTTVDTQCTPLQLVLRHSLHPSLLDFTLDLSKMARLMFLVLVLPIAMVEMSGLRGVDLKVTTVTHRPFITPNNLSSGDRWT